MPHKKQKLTITQKSAWHLAHRIRKAYYRGNQILKGIVEVDETYIGGRGMEVFARTSGKAEERLIGIFLATQRYKPLT